MCEAVSGGGSVNSTAGCPEHCATGWLQVMGDTWWVPRQQHRAGWLLGAGTEQAGAVHLIPSKEQQQASSRDCEMPGDTGRHPQARL